MASPIEENTFLGSMKMAQRFTVILLTILMCIIIFSYLLFGTPFTLWFMVSATHGPSPRSVDIGFGIGLFGPILAVIGGLVASYRNPTEIWGPIYGLAVGTATFFGGRKIFFSEISGKPTTSLPLLEPVTVTPEDDETP